MASTQSRHQSKDATVAPSPLSSVDNNDSSGGNDQAGATGVAAAVAAASLKASKWQHVWPVFACGAGLYSDGYLNAVLYPRPVWPL